MLDYYTNKDDGSKERLRRAEEQYHARIGEGMLILVVGMLIIVMLCVVLF